MTMNLWIFIFFIHLSIGQLDGDLAPRDLEFDNVAPEKNVIKTWGTIFPGTKWCGQGNKAKHEEDFGRYQMTDRCCRNHDRCPNKIKSGMSMYGLHNNGSTTLLSCECDEKFYDCLKAARTLTSKTVGILYFDLLKRKCFNEIADGNGNYQWNYTRPFAKSRIIKWISRHI